MQESSQKLLYYFIEKKLSFHAFFPTPENHKHWYHRGGTYCEEFERYFSFNNAFASELNIESLPAIQYLHLAYTEVSEVNQLVHNWLAL